MKLAVLQDYVYEIFVEFDRVCKKYNLRYSMEGGTLLGAVKYQDFVPWDDDIDIIMLREDYEKFLKLAPNELDEKYFLQSYNNVKEFPLNYAKLCHNDFEIYDYQYSHLKNMNHGIFIDIFPLDNVVMNKLKIQCNIIGVLTGARKTKLRVKLEVKGKRKVIYKILSFLPMNILCIMINKSCKKHNKKNTDYIYEVCNSNRRFKPLRTELYTEYIELKFRDKMFLAIKGYDELLKDRFGKDYMHTLPKEKDRKPSHNQNIRFKTIKNEK